MEKKIAVENELTSFKHYLKGRGCQVDSFSDGQIDTIGAVSDYDAIIISGDSQNLLGVEHVMTTTPIISAKGMTPEEVYQRLVNHNNWQ